MAQVRAGVRLRKALCAVLEHPSVSHRFEGLGLTILEVRMAKDFKKAQAAKLMLEEVQRKERKQRETLHGVKGRK